MAWLDEAMARCEAASPLRDGETVEVWHNGARSGGMRHEDGEFWTHARTDLPHALRLLREAVALLSHAKQCACWPACTPRFGERRETLLDAIEKGPA